MFGEMLDTSAAARRFYYAKLAELSPAQRLSMLGKTTVLTRRMAEAGIRRDHPQATAEELRVRLAVRLYGRALVERLIGPVPRDAR